MDKTQTDDIIKMLNLEFIKGYDIGYAKGRHFQYMLDLSMNGQAVLPTEGNETTTTMPLM